VEIPTTPTTCGSCAHAEHHCGDFAKTFHLDEPGSICAFWQEAPKPRCDHCVYWHGMTTEHKGAGNCPKLAMFFPPDFYCAFFDQSKEPPETCESCREWGNQCDGLFRLLLSPADDFDRKEFLRVPLTCQGYTKKEG
jgi:hypothetical protein